MPVCGYVDRDHLVPVALGDMTERGERPENPGVADQHVEPSIAFGQRRGEPCYAGGILEVERHQRRRTAPGTNCGVQLLKPADGARDRDHMRARACECE